MPNKIDETYQVAYQAAITRGLDPSAAKVEALDTVAATPEGKACIETVEKAIDELIQADPYLLMTDETRRKAQALLKEAYIKKVIGEVIETNPGFLISDETYREAEASFNRKLSGLRGMASTVLKDKEQRRWVKCGNPSVRTPPIDNQRATELRHGWERGRSTCWPSKNPSTQTNWRTTGMILRCRNGTEELRRRDRETYRRTQNCRPGRAHCVDSRGHLGPTARVYFSHPVRVARVLTYGWLKDKFKKRLNRRNEA